MGVHLYRHGISYFSVPKCACTSLKNFFFEVENGYPFRGFVANGRQRHIHNAAYPSRPFEREAHAEMEGHWKTAVIRDPVSRILSCWANRVVGFRCLADIDIPEADREAGVVPDPDLATFIGFFWRYRRLSPEIHHHALPMTHFLGTDPSYYDALFTIAEVDGLVSAVRERVGAVPELPRMQTSGVRPDRDALTPRLIEKIERIYASDYEAFGRFFGARPA